MPLLSRKALWLAVIFVAFQAAWFACVIGAARGTPMVGIASVALVWGVQVAFSSARSQDLVLTGAAVLLGLLWDTALMRTGVVVYASPGPLANWAPGWILALWVLFATLLRDTLSWLHGRPALSAALGSVGGALSYWSAIRLGAGAFPDLPRALVALGLGWAVMTPALTELARWLACRCPRGAAA